MKKTHGIMAMVIGAILVIMIPVWTFAVEPQVKKVPTDSSIMSTYEGFVTFHVDPETRMPLPEGESMAQRCSVWRNSLGMPEFSTGSVAVIRDMMNFTLRDGTLFNWWSRYYAIDRRTSENIQGPADIRNLEGYRDRTGFYLMLPLGTRKKSYPMYSDDTESIRDIEFVEETSMDGINASNVRVYVFAHEGTISTLVEPPLGLPEKLSGAEIKTLLKNPGLPVSDTMMIPIEYATRTESVLIVEPRTGMIVDTPQHLEEYYANMTLPGQPDNYMLLAEVEYLQTNGVELVDTAASCFPMLDLVEKWVWITLLAGGILLIVAGLILRLVFKSRQGSQV